MADSSGYSIDITLWGDLADMEDKVFEDNPAVAMKNVGIRDWAQRTGSLSQKANFVTDETNVDIKKQQEWWQASGRTFFYFPNLS